MEGRALVIHVALVAILERHRRDYFAVMDPCARHSFFAFVTRQGRALEFPHEVSSRGRCGTVHCRPNAGGITEVFFLVVGVVLVLVLEKFRGHASRYGKQARIGVQFL